MAAVFAARVGRGVACSRSTEEAELTDEGDSVRPGRLTERRVSEVGGDGLGGGDRAGIVQSWLIVLA